MTITDINKQIFGKIDWEKVNHLLPVVIQDFNSKSVLMLAYMNKEALELSFNTGYAHYFSRTKDRIWRKGEESGHTQEIKEIFLDCDNDTLLIKVIQKGVACHTGRKTCFYQRLDNNQILPIDKDISNTYSIIDQLYHTILERQRDGNSSTSYTAKLLNSGSNNLLKKVIEEAGEFCFAVKDLNKDEVIYESADLLYHSLVTLAYCDISPDKVKQELKRRFGLSGIKEKNSRITNS